MNKTFSPNLELLLIVLDFLMFIDYDVIGPLLSHPELADNVTTFFFGRALESGALDECELRCDAVSVMLIVDFILA